MSPLPVEHTLMSTRPMEKTIAAPERLDLESRTAFRRAAGEVLDLLAEGAGRLVIDLSGTRSVDSAGLGALMLIQRKAAERRQTVCLRGANEELRFLLVLTKLDDLFDMEPLMNVLDLGHSRYLVKPYELSELAAAIDAAG